MTSYSLPHQQEQDTPDKRQNAAANPLSNVWVGASAGTGKTKVLTDRLLRLMLPRPGGDKSTATPPEKILCLTFTKTGAAEMSNRIYDSLSKWAVMADEQLEADITRLTGAADAVMLREARRLFARVLDTAGGLKIMTIHSFCQSVLKRFPVEAGIAPHFELMDDLSAHDYLTRCQHQIISDAKKDPAGILAASFATLTLYLNGGELSDLMANIMSKRSLLSILLTEHGGASEMTQAIRAYLNLTPQDDESSIMSPLMQLVPEREAALKRAMHVLLKSSKKTDNKTGAVLDRFLAYPDQRTAMYDEYYSVFYTTEGEVRKKLATNESIDAMPEIAEVLGYEADIIAEVDEKRAALRLLSINEALVIVAAEMLTRYEAYKAQMGQLDYDDLIIKTSDLLSDASRVQWVLYKLDEGIDHILVDEAQDTSPQQWKVVQALADEFHAGSGRNDDKARTLFVVGDEKQSIFSFQGADPSAFDQMQRYFGAKVRDVQEGWEILLEHSFRSTRTVLELVDRVFALPDVKRGVVADIGRDIRHLAFREGHAGIVELWPLFVQQKKQKGDAWQVPSAVESGDEARARLCRKIATTIRGWVDTGEMLASKGRPIRYRDVMILVQSRGFVDQLMRALKDAHVPVAGVDRLKLKDEIAVMDVLALASFALQTHDDLTLATLLKSPLISMEEEELFILCHGRRGHLWPVLQDVRPDVACYLDQFIRKAGQATPYEFFASIFSMPCPHDAVSGKRAFFGRLGHGIEDAIGEFLNICLHYEQAHTPLLQGFIDWFARSDAEVKREQDQMAEDQVRIMTVHASKGLQAPIVFLPDATKVIHDHNKGRVRLLWPSETDRAAGRNLILWSPRSEFSAKPYADWQTEAQERQMEEYRRLLYVAMTRAEDRLYICAAQGVKKSKDGCWYDLVARGFPEDAEKIEWTGEAGDGGYALRLSHPQTAPVKKMAVEAPGASFDAARKPLPDWMHAPPPEEPALPDPLAPSKPDEDEEESALGPLQQPENWKFRRGLILHQILEVLPQLPRDQWPVVLKNYLARPGLELSPTAQMRFAEETMAVLDHPDFAPIFGAGSRAEVPIVGLAGTDALSPRILSGQIDRLLVSADRILVVDYKTNRPPPSDVKNVAPVYLKQMAAYRAVLGHIYPGRPVQCALLWTDAVRLMPLPDELLDQYKP